MRAVAMLCDYAAVADGKLFISGGGWTLTGPTPTLSAIAVKIDVPWDRTNAKIKLTIALVEQDGQPVSQVDPVGNPQPVQIQAEFEVGRPPGIPHGATIDVPLAFVVPPLPLPPGQRFSWQMTIDDETHEDWHLPFSTRPGGPSIGFPGIPPGAV